MVANQYAALLRYKVNKTLIVIAAALGFAQFKYCLVMMSGDSIVIFIALLSSLALFGVRVLSLLFWI